MNNASLEISRRDFAMEYCFIVYLVHPGRFPRSCHFRLFFFLFWIKAEISLTCRVDTEKVKASATRASQIKSSQPENQAGLVIFCHPVSDAAIRREVHITSHFDRIHVNVRIRTSLHITCHQGIEIANSSLISWSANRFPAVWWWMGHSSIWDNIHPFWWSMGREMIRQKKRVNANMGTADKSVI
jgi:hypothetical protein